MMRRSDDVDCGEFLPSEFSDICTQTGECRAVYVWLVVGRSIQWSRRKKWRLLTIVTVSHRNVTTSASWSVCFIIATQRKLDLQP